jgi:hypothetical protein
MGSHAESDLIELLNILKMTEQQKYEIKAET